ncbi:MAG: hypothetical protein R3236_07070, partial [Phycisphaeraceae bacterium]|nr:hypothetical protein [Phycisphaeraceae bacterium]
MATPSLQQNIDEPGSRNLVFTSAGRYSQIHHWLRRRSDFDLMVVDYDGPIERHRQIADYHAVRQGGEFPNLHWVYQT